MEEKKMAKTCDGCKNKVYTEEEKMLTVPYVVHQSAAARQERQIRRMWIALIVLAVALFLTNMAWIGAWTSYDYSSEEIIVEQDAQDGGNNNYIGNNGDINNGISEDNDTEKETD
jgi:hypothetical protein